MSESIITNQFKTHSIRQIIESISEPANTLYYAFAANHIPYTGGAAAIPAIDQSTEDVFIDPYRNMIFGKNIGSSDMKLMVNKYNWTSGTVYSMYDHRSGTLYDEEFFVVVDEGAYHHVWKCLYNNGESPSTAQPTFGDAVADSNLFANSDTYYETSDGYQWKYMYSVDDTTFNRFATANYIPVVPNTSVEDLASSGSIDVINVETPGSFYDNYITGSFISSEITIGGNNLVYALKSAANTQTGFYGNTFIYLTSGTGKGQYRRVANSFLTNTSVVVVLSEAFATKPDATTNYDISPEVLITSDGTQTIDCEARAVINSSSSNSVYRVEILNRGLGYNFATAEVLTGSSGINTNNAEVVPIIGPRGGHGLDPARELGAKYLGVSVSFSNNESGLVSTDNDFRQFGIMKDPKFANVLIHHVKKSDGSAGADGTYIIDEEFIQFNKKKLHGHVTVSLSDTTVSANETDTEYNDQLAVGDEIYLTSTVDNFHFWSTIASLTNSTSFELTDSLTWSSSNVELYAATTLASGVVKSQSGTFFYANELDGFISTNKLIIGKTSYAVANVSAIDQNDYYSNNATFGTFNQLTRFNGTTGTGTFNEDEVVYQLNDAATERIAIARVHSAVESGGTTNLYVTRVEGNFVVGKVATGEDSGATMTVLNKYNGDIETSSGDIIFLRNDVAVSRSNTQTETIRIILEF